MSTADPLEEMRLAAINKVAPSRNGHHGNGKPKSKSTRFESFNALVDGHLASMPATDAILWFVLWRSVDLKTGLVTMSHARLAELTGLTRRGVVKATTRMTKNGYLKRTHKGGPDGTSNVYRLTIPPK